MKFTASGSVKVYCSLDKESLKGVSDVPPQSVPLKLTVKYVAVSVNVAEPMLIASKGYWYRSVSD